MTHISSLRACRSGRKYRTRTLNLTPSLRAQRGSPCSPEGMDRHGLRPRDDANNTVIASPPYPARYRTRTLNRAFVTASVARQSMQSRDMDCFTAFAMTATFTMTGLFMESLPLKL